MWLDDDGDDDPGPGPVPDPSARHWRHPSEIAAENAKAAIAAAELAAAGRSGGAASILWPITVVGGSIAIAAFGVLGLYLVGNPTGTELVADGGSQPMGAISSSPPIPARPMAEPGSDGDNRLLGDDNPWSGDESGADNRAAIPPASGQGQQTDGESEVEAGSDLGHSTADGGDAATSTTLDVVPTSLPTSTTTASPPSGSAASPPGPAVHVGASLSSRLASLVATDGYLLTSASALDGRNRVFLRLDGAWFKAKVAAADPASDVAVLVLLDEDAAPTIPTSATVIGTPVAGADVFVGHCRPAWTEATESGPGASENSGRLVDPETEPSTGPPGDPDGSEVPGTAKPAPASEPSCDDRSAGRVISNDTAVRTATGRMVYDPIKTSIHRSTGMAGAPLRDGVGRVTGLIIDSADPVVSALPIERALAVAESLVDRGVGSPAWLGLDGRPTSIGFELDHVNPDGSAAGILAPGDIIVTVNGARLENRDHLIHLVRRSGVGQVLTVTYLRRDDGPKTVELEISAVP